MQPAPAPQQTAPFSAEVGLVNESCVRGVSYTHTHSYMYMFIKPTSCTSNSCMTRCCTCLLLWQLDLQQLCLRNSQLVGHDWAACKCSHLFASEKMTQANEIPLYWMDYRIDRISTDRHHRLSRRCRRNHRRYHYLRKQFPALQDSNPPPVGLTVLLPLPQHPLAAASAAAKKPTASASIKIIVHGAIRAAPQAAPASIPRSRHRYLILHNDRRSVMVACTSECISLANRCFPFELMVKGHDEGLQIPRSCLAFTPRICLRTSRGKR